MQGRVRKRAQCFDTLTVSADQSRPAVAAEAAARIRAWKGCIDVLVNNAGAAPEAEKEPCWRATQRRPPR